MERRKPIFLRLQAGPHRVSRGAKLASDSDHSPEKACPENPRSVVPPPSPRPDLGRSAPTSSPISFSPSLRQPSRPKLKHQNPVFRRRNYRPQYKATGAKLASDSDLSPEKSSPSTPRSVAPPPPPQRPNLGKSPAPSSPPAADVPYWVAKQRSRLPHYFYRRLPDWFYLGSAAVGVGSLATAEAAHSRSKKLDAQIEAGEIAQLGEGDEASMEDGEEAQLEDDDVPWCR